MNPQQFEPYRVSMNQNIQGNPPLYDPLYQPVYAELYTQKDVEKVMQKMCDEYVKKYGDERSVKDIMMLKQFGCRR
jgi:hypothetical protein